MPSISTFIEYILFADDTTAFYKSRSLDDAFLRLQSELNCLSNWFIANKLLFNVSKTNYILFSTYQKERFIPFNSTHKLSVSSSLITKKESVKFLGLSLDKHLTFNSHCKSISTKLLKGVYALRIASKLLPKQDLLTIYSALFLPYLHYAMLAWGGLCKPLSKYASLHSGDAYKNLPKSLCDIHILQKKAIRIISNSKKLSHHIPLCYNLGLLDLKDLFKQRVLSFFYDYFHELLPPYFSNFFKLELKNDELFVKTKFCRTEIASNSIINFLPAVWNSLDISVKSSINKSKPRFLKDCKNYFISTYENWCCQAVNCYVCEKR